MNNKNIVFSICDENDVYFTSALNLIKVLDVENNIDKFPIIRDSLHPVYAIAKRTLTTSTRSIDHTSHAKEFVEVIESLRDKYNNK